MMDEDKGRQADREAAEEAADGQEPLAEELSQDQWTHELLAEVDGELDQVTAQLRESYRKLGAGLEKLEQELAAALEAGDEMKYQAALIKKNLVLERL
ncbi:MAG: hypothetical protein JRJ56_04970, partial [Deltaproteobacteria bacterium]|nr:hypothetical protein [Deltaproteobacteria bacterium]